MGDVTLPNTLTNGETADADEVQANFDELVLSVNNDLIHRDGSKAFTVLPTGPTTTPTVNTQLVTLGAHKGRSGVLSKRVHATTSLYMTHEEIGSSGITLPDFTMPTIPSGCALVLECFIPQITVASHGAGFPNATAAMQFRLRTAADSTVAFGTAQVGVTGFNPSEAPSVYFQNQLHDNTLIAAGGTVSLTLKGTITGTAGKMQLVGSTGAPVIICARMIG